MYKSNKIICCIPARLESTRFPRKILADLGGKPLLQRTWEAAQKVSFFDEVWIAVDAQESYDFARTLTERVAMTSPDCPSGTDRLTEIRGRTNGDIWVNWQVDEPFITSEMIDRLLSQCENGADIWTLKKKFSAGEAIDDPNEVKVVTDKFGRALYFSRHAIPYMRSCEATVYKHVGIYAYADRALEEVTQMPQAEMEKAESLEQLRYLYNGLTISVAETSGDLVGIDHPDDLVIAVQKLQSS